MIQQHYAHILFDTCSAVCTDITVTKNGMYTMLQQKYSRTTVLPPVVYRYLYPGTEYATLRKKINSLTRLLVRFTRSYCFAILTRRF